MSGLPPELVERIHQEAVENDGLYRQRSTECLDLSKVHYCQTEMINWAIQRLGNLNGARILDWHRRRHYLSFDGFGGRTCDWNRSLNSGIESRRYASATIWSQT